MICRLLLLLLFASDHKLQFSSKPFKSIHLKACPQDFVLLVALFTLLLKVGHPPIKFLVPLISGSSSAYIDKLWAERAVGLSLSLQCICYETPDIICSLSCLLLSSIIGQCSCRICSTIVAQALEYSAFSFKFHFLAFMLRTLHQSLGKAVSNFS